MKYLSYFLSFKVSFLNFIAISRKPSATAKQLFVCNRVVEQLSYLVKFKFISSIKKAKIISNVHKMQSRKFLLKNQFK